MPALNQVAMWISNIRKYSLKLAQYTCHVEFLSSCLSLGIVPNGLTIRLPLSGLPPSLHSFFHSLKFQLSFNMCYCVLSQYKTLVSQYKSHIESLINIINLCSPQSLSIIHKILVSAHDSLTMRRQKALKKLSSLCHSFFQNGLSLPLTTAYPPSASPPLHLYKPDLALLLNLPAPPPAPASRPPPQRIPQRDISPPFHSSSPLLVIIGLRSKRW